MAEIVQLSEYRRKSIIKAGYRLWHRCFQQKFDARTRLNDLDPEVLGRLSDPKEATTNLYYSLILGLLGYDESVSVNHLDNAIQLRLIDIHLFVADQVRFEMMRRLGWLSRFCATQYPIVEMVVQFDYFLELCLQDPPALAHSHPGYEQYRTMIRQDQQVFIRRMLPLVLDEFKKEFLS